MRKTTLRTIAKSSIASALALNLLACGGAASPADSTSYEGPLTSTDVAAGQLAFESYCEGCHREGGDAPDIRGLALSPAHMRRQIREGEDEMPAFPPSRLSAEELEDLLAFLGSIGSVGSIADEATSGGDAPPADEAPPPLPEQDEVL
ncbi:MAG: cytochrome c [Myxococcales bacterium]|nr:cytochrome c [Myxococcales bacterium]